MLITKADGSQEVFKEGKLRNSLRRAGASKNEIDSIVRTIERSITEGMYTQEIYRHAFRLLRESAEPVAARYSLRRALFGLGPTGFPFEDYLTRLFTAEGYTVRTRQIIKGKCATHEVDLAVYKKDESFVAEAKFHMQPGIKSDLQVVMYSYARFIDLQQRPSCAADKCGIDALYVITNTKFTRAAVDYAQCSGLKLLSWEYPKGATLQERIERAHLYPITVLSHLSNKDKQNLLIAGVILCQDILKNPSVLEQNGVGHNKLQAVFDEARQLCQG